MVDTWSVCNNQGWSRISLCLGNCLNSLSHISAHTNLCNIHIAIAGNACKVFLLNVLAACSELCNSTCLGSLGGLAACVGVNLGIVYHDVDVLAGCQHVVYAAETDIVSPSVTAEYPLGLLSQEIFILNNVSADIAVNAVQNCNQLIGSSAVQSADAKCIKPLLAGCLHLVSSLLVSHYALNLSL